MASFLDNPNVQFSNYINPIDSEVYGAAIMQKQQQYDQGVEKVQGVISSVAGLEVYRDSDKQYLQNKVGSLTGSLNELAGADWSNPHLISQVGAYAAQIAGDKQVQNAVASTARIKRVYSDMEDAQKKGELNADNKIYAEDQIAAYANSTEADATFNGSYTPYFNVMEEFRKNYSVLHADENITQDAFTTNAAGDVVPNYASREVTTKGITPAKVKAAWDLTMNNSGAAQQMRISAHATYRGVDGATIMNSVKGKFDENAAHYNEEIAKLKASQTIDASQNSADIAQKISDLQSMATENLSEYQNLQKVYEQGGDEALKTTIYKADQTASVIKSYAYVNSSVKYVDNALFKGKMDQLKYEMDVQKFQFEQSSWLADYEQKDRIALLHKKKGGSSGDSDEDGGGDGGDYTFKGQDIVYNEMGRSMEQGMVGKKEFDASMQSDMTNMNNIAFKYIDMLSPQLGRVSPVKKKDDGSYTWNIDPTGATGYRSIKEAQTARDGIYTQLRVMHDTGQPTGVVKAMFDEYLPAQRAYQTKAEFAKKVEAKYRGQDMGTPVVSQQYQTPIFGPIANAIQSAFGSDVIHTPQSEQNVAARNEEYRQALIANSPKQATFISTDEKGRQDWQNRVRAMASAKSINSVDGAKWNKFLNDTRVDSKDTPLTYSVETDPSGRTFMVASNPTNKVNNQEISRVEVSRDDLQRNFPQLVTRPDPFWNEYGSPLALTSKKGTDFANTGSMSAYEVHNQPNSKYRIRYHFIGPGDDTYMFRLWIDDKTTGKQVVSDKTYSPSANNWMSHDQCIKALQGLTDDNTVTGLLMKLNSNR